MSLIDETMGSMTRWPNMDPSKQCVAMAKRTGRRCERPRVPGTTVCRLHGGAAPQARAAGQRRVQEAGALEAARRRMSADDLARFSDPVAALEFAVGYSHALAVRLGALVDEIPDSRLRYENKTGEHLRGEVTAMQKALDTLRGAGGRAQAEHRRAPCPTPAGDRGHARPSAPARAHRCRDRLRPDRERPAGILRAPGRPARGPQGHVSLTGAMEPVATMTFDPQALTVMRLSNDLLIAQDRIKRQQCTILALASALRAERQASTALTGLVDCLLEADPSWANLVRSGSGLDGFDDPRDMVG
jgi:hypothetical protein